MTAAAPAVSSSARLHVLPGYSRARLALESPQMGRAARAAAGGKGRKAVNGKMCAAEHRREGVGEDSYMLDGL